MIILLQGTETNTDNFKEKVNTPLGLLLEENERLETQAWNQGTNQESYRHYSLKYMLIFLYCLGWREILQTLFSSINYSTGTLSPRRESPVGTAWFLHLPLGQGRAVHQRMLTVGKCITSNKMGQVGRKEKWMENIWISTNSHYVFLKNKLYQIDLIMWDW